ncbi:MAG: DMT family transporter [Candidatus Polarisedimenticolia bacterium]
MSHAGLRPTLLVLVAAALFGSATPLAKALLESLGPFPLAGLLYFGAAAAVWPTVVRDGLPDRRHLSRNALRLTGILLFGGVLAPVLLLWGLTLAAAASVALWLTLETLITVLLAWFFFNEHIHRRVWLSVLLILAASVLLVWPAGFDAGQAALLVALACCCWGLDNNLTALIDGLTPAQTTLVKGLAAGTINLFLGSLTGLGRPRGHIVAAALVLGALCYGLSLVLYIGGAQQLGSARVQLIFSTAPFWGVMLAWTVFSEPVLPAQIAAGAMMLAALWLLHGERHDHEHAHEAVRHVHWHRHDDGHHGHTHEGVTPSKGHIHEHIHDPATHSHPHRPDIQHRHEH